MSKRILRGPQVYGVGNKIPLGHSIFFSDYVYRDGGDEFVPGTQVPRLRPVRLGRRAVGYFEDEVDALIEGLRAERDAAS